MTMVKKISSDVKPNIRRVAEKVDNQQFQIYILTVMMLANFVATATVYVGSIL